MATEVIRAVGRPGSGDPWDHVCIVAVEERLPGTKGAWYDRSGIHVCDLLHIISLLFAGYVENSLVAHLSGIAASRCGVASAGGASPTIPFSGGAPGVASASPLDCPVGHFVESLAWVVGSGVEGFSGWGEGYL